MKRFIVGLIVAVALMAAPQAHAVRYGVKKQIPMGGAGATPSYLCYSFKSDKMYSGNAGFSTVASMSCANDSLLGVVSGTWGPGPMVYDSLNDRVYYKDNGVSFFAINCITNSVDTSFNGYQFNGWCAYNPYNNKIYIDDSFNGQTVIMNAADYSYGTLIANWTGHTHYYPPTNSVYIPYLSGGAGQLDSLGVFSGADESRITAIYIPGMINSTKKMASNANVNRLYMVLDITDQVAIVNTLSDTLVNTLAVGDNPNNFALCPINNRMFIACNGTSPNSLYYIEGSTDSVYSVPVGDSVSTVVYNPKDSLIYIGCWRSGYVKLVDPRLPTPIVVDSVMTVFNPHFMDMKVDNGGDVYAAMYNSDNIFVISQIPQRIWRSNIANGFWFDYMAWQYSDDDGNNWGNILTIFPDNPNDSTITIQAGHTIQQTVGGPAVIADQLVVNGALELLNNSLTIADGPGEDVVVNGTFLRSGGILTVDSGATLRIAPIGYYTHAMDGGDIPVAVWDSLSNLTISGVIGNMPTGMDQVFGNINWSCFSQAADMTLPGGPSFSTRDLTINSTGSPIPYNLYLTSAFKTNLTLENFQLNDGTAILGAGGPRNLHIKKDLTVYSPAWLYLTDTLNAGIDTLFLYGNYYHSAAGIGGGGPDSTIIVFCGTDTQNYKPTGEILSGYINYQVNPGTFLKILDGNTLGSGSLGNFDLQPGATIGYSDFWGIYPTGQDTGVVRNLGMRNFSQGANYYIYGVSTGPYYTGPGIPDTVNQLIVESSFDQACLSKDVAVMDSLKLLANTLRFDGRRLSLFGPIYQTSGNMQGDSLSQLIVMGGNTAPVVLPGMVRDLGLLNINRPATVSMTDTLLIHKRLELVNGALDNGGNKLSFRDGAAIYRDASCSLSGAGPVVFVNNVDMEYGGGTITAGMELPTSPYTIRKFRLQNAADTVIVNQDSLGIADTLSLPGAIRFTGRFFNKTGAFDTTGPVGLLQMADSCNASIFASGPPVYLPAIKGGRLSLDISPGGSIMRGDITLSRALVNGTGPMTVGQHTLTLGDSLNGIGAINTDQTSSLVFKGQPVDYTQSFSIDSLRNLSWDRNAFLTITNPLVICDSLQLGNGTISDASANLTLQSNVTVTRALGGLVMAPNFTGPIDLTYRAHGGGTLLTGNELPPAGLLNTLRIGDGAQPEDTVAFAADVTVNGKLALDNGTFSVGNTTLTLSDSLSTAAGQLLTDSTSNLIVNSGWLLTLPASVTGLDSLVLNSPAGLNLSGTVDIRGSYTQSSGHILSGGLQYGPAALLKYIDGAGDTTSSAEFPASGGPRDLEVNTGGPLYLHADRTIKGILTSGKELATGASTITLDTFALFNAAGGYVNGRLQKFVPQAADTTIDFELGTPGAGLTAVSVHVFNDTVPAFITAGITGKPHQQAADTSACLRKYWSFGSTGLGADSIQLTLNYSPLDFNSPGFTEAADESTMVAGRYDNVALGWQLPTVVNRTINATDDGGSVILSHTGNFSENPDFTLGRDSAAIKIAADTTLPTVLSTYPANGAINVNINDSLIVSFSEKMDTASVSLNTVPAISITGKSWDAGLQTLTLYHAPMLVDTAYAVTVATASDSAGNAMAAAYPFGFTTADTTLPTVLSTYPANGATNVNINDSLIVSFSEKMDTASVSLNATPAITITGKSWDAGLQALTLYHAPMLADTAYAVTVTTASDSAGNPMASPYGFGFTTVSTTDTVPPTVTVTYPNGGETFVAGMRYAVRWNQSDNVGVVFDSIYYSADSGSTWVPVWAGSTINQYTWTVPQTPTTACFIKVVAFDASGVRGEDQSNNKFTIVVPDDSLKVSLIGYHDTPGLAKSVAISGGYAYIADNDLGLAVLDVSDSSNPISIGSYDTPGLALGLVVQGGYAFVADYNAGLRIIDISNPASPIEVGSYSAPGNVIDVAPMGSYVYVASETSGLRVIDISNPASPTEVGFYDTPGNANGVDVSGSYAYVADNIAGLRIVNISNPASPNEAGFYDTPGFANDVAVQGSLAFVADDSSGLRIISVANPANPIEVGVFNTPGNVFGVAVAGGFAYVADGDSGLRIINVRNPAAPFQVGYFDSPGFVEDLAINGNLIYAADNNPGLGIYRFLADTVSPTVLNTMPTNGQSGVALNAGIQIQFSEPMDISQFTYNISPVLGGLSTGWSADSTRVIIAHALFSDSTAYTVTVTMARDTANNMLSGANSFTFITGSLTTMVTSWGGSVWRLWSTPLAPLDTTALGLLGDDLGAYSDTTWRMFGYDPAGQRFVEKPAISSGSGYWLASIANASLTVTGTVNNVSPWTRRLVPGWNLIGDPYQTALHVGQLEIADDSGNVYYYNDSGSYVNDSLVRQRMWTYTDNSGDLANNGSWDSLNAFDTTAMLAPWHGYAVYAVNACDLNFYKGSKAQPFAKQPRSQSIITWQLEISADNGRAADRGLKIGISPQAREGYDRLDAEKPPLVSAEIAAEIPHPDWNQGPCHAYHYDFRPPAAYLEWPLRLRQSDQDGRAELRWTPSGNLAAGQRAYLVDRKRGTALEITGTAAVSFTGSREFAVVCSDRAISSLNLKPLAFGMDRLAPNPCAGTATVSYQLPQSGTVSLKVYNVSGQLVRTLVSGRQDAGYYDIRWDGKGDSRLTLSSGLYFVRLEYGNELRTQKLVKIR